MGNVCFGTAAGHAAEEDVKQPAGTFTFGYPDSVPEILRAQAQAGPLTCSSLEDSLGGSPHAFFVVHEPPQPVTASPAHAMDSLGARLQKGSSNRKAAAVNLPHYLRYIDKLQHIACVPEKDAHSQLHSSPLAAQLEALQAKQAQPQCVSTNSQVCMELFYANPAAASSLGVGCRHEPWSSWLDVHVLQNPLLLCQLHRSIKTAAPHMHPHCLPHPHGAGEAGAEGGMQVQAITCFVKHPQRGQLPALLIGVRSASPSQPSSSPKQLSFVSSRLSRHSQASGKVRTKRGAYKSMDEVRKPAQAKTQGLDAGCRARLPVNHQHQLQCCALAMAHIPMAVTCVNEAGRIVWQNGRSADLLGLVSLDATQDESEHRLRKLFSLDPDAWESLLEAIKEGQAWSGLVEVPCGADANPLHTSDETAQGSGPGEGALDRSMANPSLSVCSNIQERSSGNWPGILLSITDDSNVVSLTAPPTGEVLQQGEALPATDAGSRFPAAPTPIPGRTSPKDDKQARSPPPKSFIPTTASHPDDLCTFQWSPDRKGWAGSGGNQLSVGGFSAPQGSSMGPVAATKPSPTKQPSSREQAQEVSQPNQPSSREQAQEVSQPNQPSSSEQAQERSHAALQFARQSLQASMPLKEQVARGKQRADAGSTSPKTYNLNRNSEVANCSFDWLVQEVSPGAAEAALDDVVVQDVCSKAGGVDSGNAKDSRLGVSGSLSGLQCMRDSEGGDAEVKSFEGPAFPVLHTHTQRHNSAPEGHERERAPPQQSTKRARGSLDMLIKGTGPHSAALPKQEQAPRAGISMCPAQSLPLPARPSKEGLLSRGSFQGASCPQDIPDASVRAKSVCKCTHSSPQPISRLSRSSMERSVFPQSGTAEQKAAVPEEDTMYGASCRCWHSIDAFRIRGPGPGETLMVLTNQDVSDTINTQLSLQQVLDIEHKLLQEIFPAHVLESQVAAGAEAAMVSARTSIVGSKGGMSRSTSHMSLADSMDRSRHGGREFAVGSPKSTGATPLTIPNSSYERASFMSQPQSKPDLPPVLVPSSRHPLECASRENRFTLQGPLSRTSGPVVCGSNERGSQSLDASDAAGRKMRPLIWANRSFYSRLACGTSLQSGSPRSLEGSAHGGANFEVPRSPRSTPKPLTGMGCHHEHVTVMFADVKNFTAMSRAVSSSAEVMHFLHTLFSQFDELVDELEPLGIFKVETIGDCYMVAGNLLGRTEDNVMSLWSPGQGDVDPVHVVFELASRMIEAASKMEMPGVKGPVVLRIGTHTGPVTSGIAGTKCPRFCLFGDTVNFAARMEATCPPGCVHVSQATWEALGRPGTSGNSRWQARSGVEAKGIGIVQTYVWRPSRGGSQDTT